MVDPFEISDGIYIDKGTWPALYFDVTTGKGYQLNRGRKINLTSFAAFGENQDVARTLAARWRQQMEEAIAAM
jgi:hypothetical protein